MADSLTLRGVKEVQNHTGSEMFLITPTRGGDTHLVKQWWTAGNAVYVNCTMFAVSAAGKSYNLVVNSNPDTELEIVHDGAFGFTFPKSRGVKRAALYTPDMELVGGYTFPVVPGAKVQFTSANNLPTTGGPIDTVTFTIYSEALTQLGINAVLLAGDEVAGQTYDLTGGPTVNGYGAQIVFDTIQTVTLDSGLPSEFTAPVAPVADIRIINNGDLYQVGDYLSVRTPVLTVATIS